MYVPKHAVHAKHPLPFSRGTVPSVFEAPVVCYYLAPAPWKLIPENDRGANMCTGNTVGSPTLVSLNQAKAGDLTYVAQYKVPTSTGERCQRSLDCVTEETKRHRQS